MTIKFDRADSLKKVNADSKNTGDPVSQISILTDRIKYITEHLKSNRKDHSARRGLVNLVSNALDSKKDDDTNNTFIN